MIDDMTSSDESRNSQGRFSCLACHSKTMARDSLEEEFEREKRQQFLRGRIEALRGNRSRPYVRLSAAYVIEEAAKRHLQLMETTFERLVGKFNDADFNLLLNTNCSPVWSVDHYLDLSGCVLDTIRIETSTIEGIEDDGIRTLIEKLNALSPTEQLAVVEVCERVWRGYENPLL